MTVRTIGGMRSVRRVGVGVVFAVVASLLVGCAGQSNLNFAAALGWRGHVDTDVQLSEFYPSDHTVAVRFMPQYPDAYSGPLVAVDGAGAYAIGMGATQFDPSATTKLRSRLEVRMGGASGTYTVGPVLTAAEWHHLALVRAGSTLRLYFDGQRLEVDGCASAPCDLTMAGPAPSGTLRFGRLADGSTLFGHESQFYGLIDDVAVFDRALSAGEIAQLAGSDRLSGTESGLLAGWTFDSAAPSGAPLAAALTRSAELRSPADDGVAYEGVGALLPAQKVPVSQTRDDSFDAEFLPPPFQQTSMRLPFPKGQVWEVGQGWQGEISHNGRAAFAWDFNLAGVPAADTEGQPAYAAAGGPVVETQEGRDCGAGYPANYVMVEHAPDEIGAYLHFLEGSLQVSTGDVVSPGVHLADTGDTGNTGCGSFHVHFGLHNLPESQAGSLVTFPGAFSDYEVSSDQGASWEHVARGVPAPGQWVRRGTGNSAPTIAITAPDNQSSHPYGGLNLVTFSAAVSDEEDGPDCCQVIWSSSKSGAMGGGASIQHALPAVGEQVVTATVTDSDGASTSASIIVIGTNTAPTATIVAPAPGEQVFRGVPYVLQGAIGDVDQPLTIACADATWSSPGDPALTGCTPTAVFDTTGPRTLTFHVVDEHGAEGADTVTFAVVEPPAQGPPLVTITSPANGGFLDSGAEYQLTGTATDPDGATPLDYSWIVVDHFGVAHLIATGSHDPQLRGSTMTAEWTPEDQVPFSCGGGDVELRLEVTDADGQTGVDDVEVYVYFPVC